MLNSDRRGTYPKVKVTISEHVEQAHRRPDPVEINETVYPHAAEHGGYWQQQALQGNNSRAKERTWTGRQERMEKSRQGLGSPRRQGEEGQQEETD